MAHVAQDLCDAVTVAKELADPNSPPFGRKMMEEVKQVVMTWVTG